MKCWRSYIIVGFITISTCTSYAQLTDKSFSLNGGLNLACPTFIYLNKESFNETIPAYQFSVNKEFFTNKSLGIIISLGMNRNSFNADRQIGSVYSIKQIDFTYVSFEVGPTYQIFMNKLNCFGGINFRVSRIIAENYSSYYSVPTLSSFDSGLNFRIGGKLLSRPMRPFLLFNYYYGLYKIAENNVVTGTGQSLDDYIKNRSVGVQFGFYF